MPLFIFIISLIAAVFIAMWLFELAFILAIGTIICIALIIIYFMIIDRIKK